MGRYDRPVQSLSIRTINNLRSELYAMERKIALYPNSPYVGDWEARVTYIRERLGDEVVPLSRRSPSFLQHSLLVEADNAARASQTKAQEAIDEFDKLLKEEEKRRVDESGGK